MTRKKRLANDRRWEQRVGVALARGRAGVLLAALQGREARRVGVSRANDRVRVVDGGWEWESTGDEELVPLGAVK